MADFAFEIADLISDTPDPFVREQNKNLPTGQQMKTSRSVYGQKTGDSDASTSMSTLTTGQILMGVPLYDDPNNALAKQQSIMADMLGASLNGDADKSGDQGLGAYDQLIPSDILNQSAVTALQQAAQSTGPDTTGTSPGTGGTDAGASTDGKVLTANPRVQFQANEGGGALAKQDIEEGRIAPNIIFVLSVLAAQMSFIISCAASDLAGHRNQGHGTSASSLHYQYRAVDVVDLGDPSTGASIHIANDPTNPLVYKALDIINTITGPRRPDEIYTYINTGYRGFTQDNAHIDHIHIATHEWGDPMPTTSFNPTPAPDLTDITTGI